MSDLGRKVSLSKTWVSFSTAHKIRDWAAVEAAIYFIAGWYKAVFPTNEAGSAHSTKVA